MIFTVFRPFLDCFGTVLRLIWAYFDAQAGGPAEMAGVQLGTCIVAINGVPVRYSIDFDCFSTVLRLTQVCFDADRRQSGHYRRAAPLRPPARRGVHFRRRRVCSAAARATGYPHPAGGACGTNTTSAGCRWLRGSPGCLSAGDPSRFVASRGDTTRPGQHTPSRSRPERLAREEGGRYSYRCVERLAQSKHTSNPHHNMISEDAF